MRADVLAESKVKTKETGREINGLCKCCSTLLCSSHFFFFCRTSAITSAGSAQTWPRCFISIHGPDTSSQLERGLERQRLSSPCIFFFFFCICPPLCPSVKIRDLSHFGYSSSFSRVAFSADSRKQPGRTCHLEPSESTELMTSVTKYAVFYFCCSLMCFRTSSDVINRREFGAGPRLWRHFSLS